MAAERPDKKERKEKKRSEEAGVSKTKKDKKEKKEKEKLAAAVDIQLQQDAAVLNNSIRKPTKDAKVPNEDENMDDARKEELPLERTIVPFAVPVAEEKGMKKVYKTIRKAAKNGTLKRGVKEVVKALRKSPSSGPGHTSFPGIVVIAGDISPPDVISHLPALCEDHNVPFIFVTSRAELGALAKTKRPTSVVMIMEKFDPSRRKKPAKEAPAGDKDNENDDDGDGFGESYTALVKYVQKEYAKQAFWAKGNSTA